MPEYPKEIEVGRVMNLVESFGWSKVKEEMIGEELHITIKKEFAGEVEKATETPAG